MNAHDIVMYGQRTVLQTIEGFPDEEWERSGVTGVWSAKDVIAHLASHELVLLEVLGSFLEQSQTPTLAAYTSQKDFNDRQVGSRKGMRVPEVLAELNDANAKVLSLIQRLPAEKLREVGTIPWYGPEYSLDDLIVYGNYGHKREHSAEIAAYLDRRKS